MTESDPHRRADGGALPRWFDTALACTLAAALILLCTGMVLAMAGWYRPLPTLVLVVPPAVAIGRVILRDAPPPTVPRSTHVLTALVLCGVVGVTAWNVSNHAEHLIVDRDPGVYVNTARWLTDEGSLRVEGVETPFGGPSDIQRSVPGFNPTADGDLGALAPQFAHGLPVFMTPAGWIAPSLLLSINALIGGLALLCVFAVASTCVRPFWAACATGLLSVTFPFVFMVRDAYSEPLAMVALFGGLWLLARERSERWWSAAVAGGLLGIVCAIRIDGFVSLVPLAAVLGLWLRHARRSGDTARARWIGITAAATIASAGLGLVDVRYFSLNYFRADLEDRLPTMLVAIAAAAVVGFVAAPWLWRCRDRTWSATKALRLVVGAAALGISGVLVWMATVRPDAGEIPELVAETPTRTLDLLDQLQTLTYRWLEWYLGRPGAALGFVGLVTLTGLAALRRSDASSLALPGVVLATTMLYLVSPNITPDHPWAMRRFLAVSIPGLLIAAAWVMERIHDWRPSRVALAGPALAIAALAATAVPIVQTTEPLRSIRIGHPTHSVLEQLCDTVDDDDAVLVLQGNALSLTFPVTVRSWCGVPAAGAADGLTAPEIRDVAEAWAEEGRDLVVIATSPEPVEEGDLGVRLTPLPEVGLAAPEATLTRPPEELVPDSTIIRNREGVLRLHVGVIPVD